MRKSLAALLPIALLAAACGSSSSSSSSASSSSTAAATSPTTSATTASSGAAGTAQLGDRTIAGLGTVLVNRQGRTLYVFAPDKHAKVTCVGGCASAWHPLKIAAGQKPTTLGTVRASLIASDPDPDGGRVVTYAGWPLYVFVGDPSAGTVHGQDLNSSGGLWYVITPAGTLITKKASSGSSSGGSTY